MNSVVPAHPVKTMSSREISEIVESRHDNVKTTMERLKEKGLIQLTATKEVNHKGQTVKAYLVNERDSYVVVAQLSPEFTARLVDRWKYLEENKSASPQLTELEEKSRNAKALLDMAKAFGFEGNQALLSADRASRNLQGFSPLEAMGSTQLINQENKAHFTVTEIGKMLSEPMSAVKLNKYLDVIGMQENVSGKWIPTDNADGHFVMLDTGKKRSDGTPVTQVKWYRSIVEIIENQ